MASLFSALVDKFRHAPEDVPIREELYSIERLEQYAAFLATEHEIARKPRRVNLLLPRLEENSAKLIEAYQALAESIRSEHVISPAAEWLVDNFHIVEEQVREIREDLPRGYYRELPKLAQGPFKDYPRIYAFSIELIAHTDSHIDTETLRRFIDAYQKIKPLSIGELWAVPISLRLALVENLRRLTTRITASRGEREEADRLADRLLEAAPNQSQDLTSLLPKWRKRPKRSFVVQLIQRLRDQDPAVMPVMESLDKQLTKDGLSLEQIVHEEHHRQAASQVTVGNIITSMRLLSTPDWKDFFEKVSRIDPELAKDPAQVYARMDFATRDRYRHVIERISKGAKKSELEIAQAALQLAEAAKAANEDTSRTHIGYYLVSDGLATLEAEVGYRPRVSEHVLRAIERRCSVMYLGTFAFLTALILFLFVFALLQGNAAIWITIVGALLALIPASDLAINVLNWDITHTFKPRLLPKIDLTKEIPPEARTMVVVPAILADEAIIATLIDKLEIAYLANQDEHLHFALLGSFADANSEKLPNDENIVEAARHGIEELNRRYSDGKPIRFHLFHRCRQW